jgi:hypothetical protein
MVRDLSALLAEIETAVNEHADLLVIVAAELDNVADDIDTCEAMPQRLGEEWEAAGPCAPLVELLDATYATLRRLVQRIRAEVGE